MSNENKGHTGSGNFANDREKASEAGRKGGHESHGQQSHQGSTHEPNKAQPGGAEQSGGKQRGGSGNFANDHEKASEAGKKGGSHSHGGK